MEGSANLQPSSPRIYAKERTTSSTTAIWSCTWNWDCVSPTSIVFSRLIKHRGWKTTYTSTFINIQLRKMILKKISLRWCTTRSLVSVSYVHLFFYMTYSFHVKFFLFMIICSYVFIDSLVKFILYDYLFLCIDSFIVAEISIFMFTCSYILIHSLQVKFFSLCFFFLVYSLIFFFLVYSLIFFMFLCSYVLIHSL